MTRTATGAQRAAPVPTQHLAELAWKVHEAAGEDVLLPREQLAGRIHATDGQFERAKGYIRDHITMEKGKAFLSYRSGYMITTDPAKISEYAALRMRRINTELRRLLSGAINPLGEQVAEYEVLAMFQDEIAHMTRTYDRMQKATLTMPTPVRAAKPKRRRRTPSGA
ncbi:hypothetical protein [Streptomyces sp. 3211]|uniref:hypothetical protein n=1 Tax=Streptomyces sp. 3211 TaxID=1964449 RepID=UPI0009A4B0F3|nr:hypothetical protein [Streptomyces sp. 3211]